MLIKRQLLIDKKICFEHNISNGEDSLFVADLMSYTRKAYKIGIEIYGWRKGVFASLSQGEWNNPQRELLRELKILQGMQKHFENHRADKYADNVRIQFIRCKKNAIRAIVCNNNVWSYVKI